MVKDLQWDTTVNVGKQYSATAFNRKQILDTSFEALSDVDFPPLTDELEKKWVLRLQTIYKRCRKL